MTYRHYDPAEPEMLATVTIDSQDMGVLYYVDDEGDPVVEAIEVGGVQLDPELFRMNVLAEIVAQLATQSAGAERDEEFTA